MTIIYVLIPIGLALLIAAVAAFFWAVKSGQFDDLDTPAWRILMDDDERTFTYYNLNVGYNILPGEGFIGEGRAYNTNMYLIAGLGSTRFAGDDRFTVNFGAGFRFLLTDSMALHVDFRDHLFDIDLLGEEKTVHNLEGHIGVTVFF